MATPPGNSPVLHRLDCAAKPDTLNFFSSINSSTPFPTLQIIYYQIFLKFNLGTKIKRDITIFMMRTRNMRPLFQEKK